MDIESIIAELLPDTLDADLDDKLKTALTYDVPVESIRQIGGVYLRNIDFYVQHRLDSYIESNWIDDDLAEFLYADFEGWNEDDFKRVKPLLLRNLRNYCINNGIDVEKRAGYAVAKSMAEVIKDPENIPMLEKNKRPSLTLPGENAEIFEPLPIPDNIHTGNAGQPSGCSPTIENGMQVDISPNQGIEVKTEADYPEQPTSYPRSNRLTDVAKTIDKKKKYAGLPDEDIEGKIAHFKYALDVCKIQGDDDRTLAIPLFLTDQAEVCFRTTILPKCTNFENAIQLLRDTFLSPEARRANDVTWDALSILYVEKVYKTKTNRETLDKLFMEIERLRRATTHSKVVDEKALQHICYSKLLSAVTNTEIYSHIRRNPPEGYINLRNTLHEQATLKDTNDLLSQPKKQATPNIDAISLLTDRLFRRGGPANRSGRNGRNTEYRYAGGNRKCWVCAKENCHSRKHSKEERANSRRKFRSYMTEVLVGETDESDNTQVKTESADGENSNDDEEDSDSSDASSFATVLHTNQFMMQKMCDPSEGAEFFGIALDTCCTKYCTASKEQYLAYCLYTGQYPNIIKDGVNFNTSSGKVKSIGYATVYIPFGNLKPMLKIKVHIFDYPSTAPMLLSYSTMKEEGWNMIITEKRLVSGSDDSKFIAYEERSGLPVYMWNLEMNSNFYLEPNITMYTLQQLRNIHRRTGHPAVNRLMNVLESIPRNEPLPDNTRAMLHRVKESCKACQTICKPPERFRFVIHDESRFNHEILIDTFKLSDGNVLHVMCSSTKYQLGRFVDVMNSQTAWSLVRECWIDILSGAPDIIKIDAGSQMRSKYFKENAKTMGIHVQVIPTEAHNKIGLLERYHKIVREVYEKLKIDDPQTSRESRLATTFRCVNDTAGFDGIVPTLLVFGTYPKLGIDVEAIAPTTVERARIIRAAQKHAATLKNADRIQRASRNGPAPNVQLIEEVKRLPENAPVLVYREKIGWTGPLKFIAADDHGAYVVNEKGNEIRISLHVVKPYIPERWLLPSSMFSKTKEPLFIAARKKEIDDITTRGVIKLVDKLESRGHRIYHGSFLDKMKSDGIAKTRMVVCATNDFQNHLTYSPTIRRTSTRLAFAYAACRSDFFGTTRDVTRAFLQSDTTLRRPVYMELPHEMRKGNENKVIKVVKPLYGLPESPLNWYATYTSHYKKKLSLKGAAHDPCMLIRSSQPTGCPDTSQRTDCPSNTPCDGLILLQVDDSIAFGTKDFHEKEEKVANRFENHGSRKLDGTPTMHNGANITYAEGIYTMDQSANLKKLTKIPKEATEAEAYKHIRSQNAAAAYPASLTRPDLLCYTSKFAQVTTKNFQSITRKRFNKFIEYCHEHSDIPLKFVQLDLSTLHVAVFTDASFSTTDENTSQLGIAIVLRDAHANCNVVHMSSIKAKRRARSVLSAEMFALLDGFDCGYVIRQILSNMMGRSIELHIFTDSKCAYHITTTLITTKEKRLMLDVHLLRESYERREITKITWISGASNIADCLTKTKNNGTLGKFLKTNKIEICLEGWVDRDFLPVHANSEVQTARASQELTNACANRWKQHESRQDVSIENDSIEKEKMANVASRTRSKHRTRHSK